MQPAALRSAFDVAFWFADTAAHDNEYLQPQKLQRLMFLAQAYYIVAFNGRSLMPAVFVADEIGPIEPNVYAAFSKGRPDIDVELFLPAEVEQFLSSIWRRFGHYSTERLSRMTNDTIAFRHALKQGRRSEITVDAIRISFTRAESTPAIDQIVKPKILRTQSGKPVAVKTWVPGTAKPAVTK